MTRRSETRPEARNERGRKLDLIVIADMMGYRPEAPKLRRRERVRKLLERFEQRDDVWYMVRGPAGGRHGRLWAREEALDLLRPPDPTRGDRLRRDIDDLTTLVRTLQRGRNADAIKLRELQAWRERVEPLLADVSALYAGTR
jgi:hypothetical protein